jgi:predicted dehydrogenase
MENGVSISTRNPRVAEAISPAQRGYYPPRLRAAIVGTGGIARIHGWRLQDLGSTVVAVAGRDLDGARGLARELRAADHGGQVEAFDHVGRMLDTVRPDVLHVCTPHGTHARYALEAISRGIHVICEKPLATLAEDSLAVVSASRSANVHAAVCLTKRSYPMVAELRARVKAGKVGPVQAITGGFRSWDSNHDNWGWGFDPTLGGSSYATADLGVHWLDLAEHVTGDRIIEVDARFSTMRPVRFKNGEPHMVTSEDYARVSLEFSTGAVGSAVFSGVTAGEPNGCEIQVDGPDGGLTWRVDQPDVLVERSVDGAVTTVRRDPDRLAGEAARLSFAPAGHGEGFADAFRNLIRDVYTAIGTDPTATAPVSYPTVAEGHRLVTIVEAIQESALTRRAVSVD